MSPLELNGVPTAEQERQERLEGVTSTAGPVSTAGCFWASSPLPDPLSLHLPRHPTHQPRHHNGFVGLGARVHLCEAASPELSSRLLARPGPSASASLVEREFAGLKSGVGTPRRGGDRLYAGVRPLGGKDY